MTTKQQNHTIKMILLDLDGTLLDSQKQLSPANYRALERAARSGVFIVPCTGRFYGAMPDVIQKMPFVRYAILINGAEIYDIQADQCLHREDIPLDQALALFDYMDGLPAIYDCFQDGWGWMDRKFYEKIDDYVHEPHINTMVKTKRTPLEDFKSTLMERGRPIQKSQLFFGDLTARAAVLERIVKDFPQMSITNSLSMNIEINSQYAHKGHALTVLCDHLGIDPRETMAFGDGSNDTTMIETAGIGVVMENGISSLKEVADYITTSNDADGVAVALAHFGVGDD